MYSLAQVVAFSKATGGGGSTGGIDPNVLATNTPINEIVITATDIANNVFVNMNVKKISAPNIVTLTGNTVFNSVLHIEELNFPELITYTGINVFANSAMLKRVNFPKLETVKSSFLKDSGLIEANFPALTTTMQTAFMQCYSLISAYLPSLTAVKYRDFRSCTALKTVDFGENSTAANGSIGSEAFYGCSVLEALTIHTPYVCSLENVSAFNGCSALAHIYVPADLVDTYKVATNWTTYADIIGAIPA